MWAYIACACGLFIYQSLDAIDGKQARRTNSSSPLGELFDHGCDSLSTGMLDFISVQNSVLKKVFRIHDFYVKFGVFQKTSYLFITDTIGNLQK